MLQDLKRLTQKRMQGSSSAGATLPLTPKAAPAAQDSHLGSRPSTPTINMAVVNAGASAPVVQPKTGMTVQELKQLTTLRLASQSVPRHQSEITGLVSKAVLTNVAKSHYRDSLRNSLTPGSTPKRGPAPASSSSRNNQLNNFNLTMPEVRGNRSRSRSSQMTKTVETPSDAMQQRYSYSGGQTIDDYLASFDNDGSNSSQVWNYLLFGCTVALFIYYIDWDFIFSSCRITTRTLDRSWTWTTTADTRTMR